MIYVRKKVNRKRPYTVTLRLSDFERKCLELAAEKQSMKPTEFLRHIARQESGLAIQK